MRVNLDDVLAVLNFGAGVTTVGQKFFALQLSHSLQVLAVIVIT